MEPTYLDSSLINWLLNNSFLTKFIEINMLNKSKNDLISICIAHIEMMRQKQLLRLNKFYETALKALYNESETDTNHISSSLSISDYNLHILHYVNQKMLKIRRNHLKNSMQLTQSMINLIKDPKLASQNIEITVDEDNFFTEMISDPPDYYRLKDFSKSLFQKANPITTLQQFQDKILKLLNEASLQVDKASNYFAETSLQEEFDDILLHKNFPLFESINNLLNTFSELPRKSFTPKILDLFDQIILALKLELDPLLSSTFYIFLIRSIFSHSYARNPDYFYPKFDQSKVNLQTIAKNIPVSDFAIPDEFLPPHQKDDKMIDVFSKNKFFLNGTLHLQFAAMVLNPIDAIFEVHEMMTCNRRGVEIIVNNKEVSIYPFETTFGLYLASVMASDLTNFDQVAKFIEDFAPLNGMCPEFDYTATTTKAAREFCMNLVNEFSC